MNACGRGTRGEPDALRARTEDRRARTEGRRARTGVRRARTGVRRARTEGRRAHTEGRRARTGGRRARTEGRRARTEVRRARTEGRRDAQEGAPAGANAVRCAVGRERSFSRRHRFTSEGLYGAVPYGERFFDCGLRPPLRMTSPNRRLPQGLHPLCALRTAIASGNSAPFAGGSGGNVA
jgi:hypothetical protein